jgi:hypothetical protein
VRSPDAVWLNEDRPERIHETIPDAAILGDFGMRLRGGGVHQVSPNEIIKGEVESECLAQGKFELYRACLMMP